MNRAERLWFGINRRCDPDSDYVKSRPTYQGCRNEFSSFEEFKQWAESQAGFYKKDGKGKFWQIDKDLISPGSKVYSPDACIFVPSQLNMFMTDRAAARGEWPIGVSWQKSADKFKAYCRNPFTCKQEHLGMFSDPDAAHEAWRKRKHELACLYAEQQTDPRIAQALRTRYL